MKKMKKNYRLIWKIAFSIFTVILFCHCNSGTQDNIVFIDNGKIKLGFEKKTGEILIFNDLSKNYEFIDQTVVNGLPWEITFHSSSTQSSDANKIIPAKY